MDDKIEVGQVDAAGGDVGRDADAGPAIAHRLQRVGALGLAQFARQRDHGKAAVEQPARQMLDAVAGGAEHQRVGAVEIQQRVDDGVFALGRRNGDELIVDIAVLLALAGGGDAQGVALEGCRQLRDGFGHGSREHQGAAGVRRRGEDELEILAKTEVEHLVGLIEDGGAQRRDIERTPGEVVAQPARRANDDMSAALQRPPLGAHVHAADAGGDQRAGILVEPVKFALHLDRQFARRRDNQGKRKPGGVEPAGPGEQGRRDRHAEGDGFTRARLR